MSLITLFYFFAFAKSLTSPPLGKNKKIAASAMVSGHRCLRRFLVGSGFSD